MDRQRVGAVLALPLWGVDLPAVVEGIQRLKTLPVVDERVQRREERHRVRISCCGSRPGGGAYRRLQGKAFCTWDTPDAVKPFNLNLIKCAACGEPTHELLALQRPVVLHPDAVR